MILLLPDVLVVNVDKKDDHLLEAANDEVENVFFEEKNDPIK